MAFFDATNVPQRQSRDIMPRGNYLGYVSDTEVGSTQSGGTAIKVECTLQEPPEYRGRKVYDNINIKNKSAEAERIANETLSQLCHATGRLRVENDPAELRNIPICIAVGIDKAQLEEDGSEKFPAKNIIRDYKPASKYVAPATAPTFDQPGVAFGAPVAFNPATAGAAAFPQPSFPTAAMQPSFAPPPTFAPPPAAPVMLQPPAPPPTISPDGAWRLENGAWVPNTPPPPAAPPVAAAGAPMPWSGAAPAPAAPTLAPTATGPWAQG